MRTSPEQAARRKARPLGLLLPSSAPLLAALQALHGAWGGRGCDQSTDGGASFLAPQAPGEGESQRRMARSW
jgi:hypothetical protein